MPIYQQIQELKGRSRSFTLSHIYTRCAKKKCTEKVASRPLPPLLGQGLQQLQLSGSAIYIRLTVESSRASPSEKESAMAETRSARELFFARLVRATWLDRGGPGNGLI